MTKKGIEKELEKIYNEMNSWSEANRKLNYVISKDEIQKRESILSVQQILYRIQDAKEARNRSEEYFNLALYYLTKSTQEDC